MKMRLKAILTKEQMQKMQEMPGNAQRQNG